MPAKMNPFEVKTKPADRYYMDWQKLYPRPYDKNEVDPYTRLRIILMNGTEYEATGSPTSSTATAPTTTCAGNLPCCAAPSSNSKSALPA